MRYIGKRDATGSTTVYFEGKGIKETLDLRLDLANKSPTGFEWGYGGSGPSQLALAMLSHALRVDGYPDADDIALRHFQKFKTQAIVHFGSGGWMMSHYDVIRWFRELPVQKIAR